MPPGPTRTSIENAAFFACITNSASTSATLDLTTHASGPRTVFQSGSTTGAKACARGIFVIDAGLGKLAVTREDGVQISISNLADSQMLNVRVKKILPTSRYSAILVYW